MQETVNLKLKKIELTDSPPDITVINHNWDKLDEEITNSSKQIEDLKESAAIYSRKGNSFSITDFNLMIRPILGNTVIDLSVVLNAPLGTSGNQRIRLEVTVEEETDSVITQKVIYQEGVYNSIAFFRVSTNKGASWKNWVRETSQGYINVDYSEILNGWNQVEPSRLCRTGNIVTFQGSFTQGTIGANTVIYQVPIGYRPNKKATFSIYVDSSGTPNSIACRGFVDTNGDLRLSGAIPNGPYVHVTGTWTIS